jgi:type I restriction enzyme, S subunit
LRSGAAQPHVYAKDIAQLLLPLPSLPEQRRIAAILDQADALRAKRREALAQLDSLTQSIFIEMFGDPVENPNGWPPVQLSDVSDIVTGFAFKSEEYVDGGSSSIKLCRGANVMPGRLDWSDLASWPASKIEQVSAFQLQTGDIVMAMDRPWISEGFKVAQVSKHDRHAQGRD